MANAITLAKRTGGPNPSTLRAGAIIVDDGQVIAEGWQPNKRNTPAALVALHSLKCAPSPRAALYSTLEPHSEDAPAILTALLKAGLSKLVIGASHPAPSQSGQSVRQFRATAKLELTTGVLEHACQDLNLITNYWIRQQTPFIAAKIALTLDGKLAAASGHSKWITGATARQDVHQWRRLFPAIAVGASTVLADDPQLTARLSDAAPYCPLRFVLDTNLRTLDHATVPRLYSDPFKQQTIVLCADSLPQRALARLKRHNLNYWLLPTTHSGQVCLSSFSQRCKNESIQGIYFEPGPQLFSSLIENQLLDYLFVYKAPKIISDTSAIGIGSDRQTQSMQQAYTIQNPTYTQFGEDFLVRGQLK